MTNMRLTERRIRDARHDPGKTSFLWDVQVPGFGIRCTRRGTKSYVLWIRSKGKKTLLTLARVSAISLDQARKSAASELDQIARGGDDLLTRRAASRDAPTVDAGTRWFLETHIPRRLGLKKMAPRTAVEYQRQIARYITPAIGHLPIEQVSRQDIEAMLDAIGWDKPSQFGRVRSLARSLFNCFEVEGWRREGTNPATRITTPTERERTRTLSPNEQTAFHTALARMTDNPAVAAIRFLNATGCRLNEARNLKWSFIDHETCNITLPATKTGKKVIRATGEAMDIVNGCARINGNPYVFAGRGAAAPLGERSIRAAFNEAAKMAGLLDVTPHDLRRSFITDSIAAGVPLTTVADLVGHASIIMTARYAKAADGEVREAGEKTAAARKARRGAEVIAIGGARA